MNSHNVVNGDDEQFTVLLAHYSEALTAGRGLDPADDLTLSAEMRERLQRALGCLQRLRQLRLPASEMPTQVSDPGITLHNSIVGGKVGRFRILRTLGQGGGGIVFLAYDPDLRREVAVKVPHLSALLEPEMQRRFLREARAAASLDHPNLVPVHEVGESNGVCYLVSAYCRGGSLAQWLAMQTSPIPVRQAAEILLQLADALQYVHDHGIYHRDIKPGNILLDPTSISPQHQQERPLQEMRAGEEFTPRLTDFGLAKLHDAQTESTRSGMVLGTLSYMAPEQVEGRVRDIGPATDVYGLGAVLYEMLAGQPPFRGVTDADTLRQVLTEETVPLRRERKDMPRDLETICLKCLEKEPARRYATASDLASDLSRFLKGEAIEALPVSRMQRFWIWSRKLERIRNAGAIMLFSSLGMIGWNLFSQIGVLLGVIQTPRLGRVIAYSYCCIFAGFLPMAWLGRLTMARKAWAVWAGAVMAALLSAYYIFVAMMIAPIDIGLPFTRQQLLVASTPFMCLAAIEFGAYLLALLALCRRRDRSARN